MMVADYYPGSYSEPLQFTARTDATGNQYLRMDFLASAEPRPYTVDAQAAVMDVNRQTWAASTSLLVHPSELYVGLRSPATFVEKGEPLVFDVIVTDVDGKTVAERPVDVRAVRKDYEFQDGSWVEVQVDEQVCEVLSAAEAVTCTFETPDGGRISHHRPGARRRRAPQPHAGDALGQRWADGAFPRSAAAAGAARPRQAALRAGRRREGPRAGALRHGQRPAHGEPRRHALQRTHHAGERLRHAGDSHRGGLHPQREHPGRRQRLHPAAGRQGRTHSRCARTAGLRHRLAHAGRLAAQPHARRGGDARRHEARPRRQQHARHPRGGRGRQAGAGCRAGHRRGGRGHPGPHQLPTGGSGGHLLRRARLQREQLLRPQLRHAGVAPGRHRQRWRRPGDSAAAVAKPWAAMARQMAAHAHRIRRNGRRYGHDGSPDDGGGGPGRRGRARVSRPSPSPCGPTSTRWPSSPRTCAPTPTASPASTTRCPTT